MSWVSKICCAWTGGVACVIGSITQQLVIGFCFWGFSGNISGVQCMIDKRYPAGRAWSLHQGFYLATAQSLPILGHCAACKDVVTNTEHVRLAISDGPTRHNTALQGCPDMHILVKTLPSSSCPTTVAPETLLLSGRHRG